MADLGEFGLLRSLRRYLDPTSNRLLVAAPDDDAALWRGDPLVVGTMDTMVEGIDFRLSWPGFDYRLLGRRLISINLSDLAAMGGEPRYALVSLSLRGNIPASDVRRLYQGIAERAHQYDCLVAGGDLSATEGPLTLTATVIGRVQSAAAILRRTGARPGWTIGVTGSLGAAAAGLRLLEGGEPASSPQHRRWVAAQLDPTPQLSAGRLLVDVGVRVGGDISDGLVRELQRITEGDGLGAVIEIERLPLADGLEEDQWPLAIRDSEDFELVCAAPAPLMAVARRALEKNGVRLTVVGRVEARRGIRLQFRGKRVSLEGGGYEHFR